MPTYEYVCTNGHTVIEERRMSDEESISTCSAPKCNESIRRVYSLPSISFKGSGFYSTGG